MLNLTLIPLSSGFMNILHKDSSIRCCLLPDIDRELQLIKAPINSGSGELASITDIDETAFMSLRRKKRGGQWPSKVPSTWFTIPLP